MEKRTILSYLISFAMLMGSMNPLLAISGQQMRNAHDAINQFTSLNLNTVSAEEYTAKKEAALKATAQFDSTQRAKYLQTIGLQDKRYVAYAGQPQEDKPEQPKTKTPVSRDRVQEDNLMPEDFNFDFAEQPKKSFFGEFKKQMPKIMMAAIGAVAIGAYEWFASSNPGTVPELGIKKMLSSVWSWFTNGKKKEKKEDDASKKSDESDQKEDNADQNKDVAKDDTSTQPVQKDNEVKTTTGQSDVLTESAKIEKSEVNKPITVPVNKPVETKKVIQPTPTVKDTTVAKPTHGVKVNYDAVIESEEEDDLTNTTPIIITNTPSVKPPVSTSPGIKVNNSHIVYNEQDKPENKSTEIDGDTSNEFGSISDSDDSFESASWSDEDKNVAPVAVTHEPEIEVKTTEVKPAVVSEVVKPVELIKSVEVIKPAEVIKPKIDNVQVVDSWLDKMIGYSKTTGEWFVNFFSKKNDKAYKQYVDELGKTIALMEQDKNNVQISDDNGITQATKNFAAASIQELKETHEILKNYVNKTKEWGASASLGLELQGQRDKNEKNRNDMLQSLQDECVNYPALKNKTTNLQTTIQKYAKTLEDKGWYMLGTGLKYRLGCK